MTLGSDTCFACAIFKKMIIGEKEAMQGDSMVIMILTFLL
jgi:hypothetical protein